MLEVGNLQVCRRGGVSWSPARLLGFDSHTRTRQAWLQAIRLPSLLLGLGFLRF